MYESLFRDKKARSAVMHLAHRLRDKTYETLMKHGIEDEDAANMADSHWKIWEHNQKMSPGLVDWCVMAARLLTDPEYAFYAECQDENSMRMADNLEDKLVHLCVNFHMRRHENPEYEEYQHGSNGKQGRSHSRPRSNNYDGDDHFGFNPDRDDHFAREFSSFNDRRRMMRMDGSNQPGNQPSNPGSQPSNEYGEFYPSEVNEPYGAYGRRYYSRNDQGSPNTNPNSSPNSNPNTNVPSNPGRTTNNGDQGSPMTQPGQQPNQNYRNGTRYHLPYSGRTTVVNRRRSR